MKARFESDSTAASSSSESPPSSLDSANSSSSSNSGNSANSGKSSGHLSATERRRQFRKQALSETNMLAAARSARLSTSSLHNTAEIPGGESPGGQVPGDGCEPLQRRNSIHNVPYVDVNDPETRARMERYKEERRTMLRARYKVEDYKTKKPAEEEGKVRKPEEGGKAKEQEEESPPKKQQQQQKGRLRKDSFGKKSGASPKAQAAAPAGNSGSRNSGSRSSGRFSLQEKASVVDFKVPLRQMPIEKAPSFKKSSISDFYHPPTSKVE